jgi:pimeloyl-ACP methyl ester carboxylesterase
MPPHTKLRTAGFLLIAPVLAILLGGCANRPANPKSNDVLFFVPGVAGDGGAYDGLIRGLRAAGVKQHIEVLAWGAPGPLFVMNFQNDAIHRKAEAKLAGAMREWRKAHAGGRIDVLGHSAGCGVTLGALALADSPAAGTVVLLNPSVSPTYDLSAPLAKVEGTLHLFYSDRDTFFLTWRTSTFWTYDNVKTKAAGNVGFDLTALPEGLRKKVVQHPREAWWADQGNDGSHLGTTAEEFATKTLGTLLR